MGRPGGLVFPSFSLIFCNVVGVHVPQELVALFVGFDCHEEVLARRSISFSLLLGTPWRNYVVWLLANLVLVFPSCSRDTFFQLNCFAHTT